MTSPANDQSRTASSAPSVSSLSRPERDRGGAARDPARDELLGPALGLVVEGDARAGVQAVVLAQRADELVRGELGDRIRRASGGTACPRSAGSRARRRRSRRRRRRTRARRASRSRTASRIAARRPGDRAHRLPRALPRGGDERGRGEVVDLARRPRARSAARSVSGVEQVAADQLDALAQVLGAAERRAAALVAHEPDHAVALLEQQLGQERAVLTGQPGDQRGGLARHGAQLMPPSYTRASASGDDRAARTRRATRSRLRAPPGSRSPARRPIACASAPRVAGRDERVARRRSSPSAPTRLAATGSAGGHRLGGRQAERLGRARRHERDRRAARAAARARRRRRARRSARRAPRARALRSAARSGPSPAITSGMPADAAGVDRHVDALLRRQARDDERVGALAGALGAGGARRVGERAHGRRDHVHALPRQRRAERAQALARELAGDDEGVGLLDHAPLPQRQRGGVGGRLGHAAAAVQAHAGKRVAAVAARALGAAREAHADRADEPVLVQVQHDARAGLARGGERAPAERRLQVVRVHDARAARAHGARRPRRGCQAAAQQPERGARARRARAESRASSSARLAAAARARATCRSSTDALLAAGRAIAVVQEQDHRAREPIGRRARAKPRKPAANLDCPDDDPPPRS